MHKKWIAAGAWLAAASMGALPQAASAQGSSQITILRHGDGDRYDPHKARSRAVNELFNILSDTLVSLDYDLKTIHPGLASAWTVSKDARIYRFTLREDVTFCDGRPLKADDVTYSLNRLLAPETRSPSATLLGKVKTVRSTAPYAVEIELAESNTEFLARLADPSTVVVDRHAVEKLGADFGIKGFNGTGPFCWVKWEQRNELVVARHPTYRWGPPIYQNRGPAAVDRLVWKLIPEESTRVAALLSGQGDLTYYIPRWAFDQFEASGRLNVTRAEPYYSLLHLGFRVARPLVSDPRVRQAINLAIDREQFAKSSFFGRVEPAYSYIQSSATDYAPAIEKRFRKLDRAAAARLLDEAGWTLRADGYRYNKEGVKLAPVLLTPGVLFSNGPEAIQADLKQVGIDLKWQAQPLPLIQSRLATKDDFELYGWGQTYLSAGDFLNLLFPSTAALTANRMGWKDPETDRLLEAGRTATSAEARAKAYGAAQARVFDADVLVPLFHDHLYVASSKRLAPLRAHGLAGVPLYKGLDLRRL